MRLERMMRMDQPALIVGFSSVFSVPFLKGKYVKREAPSESGKLFRHGK
jgi:hypothetical protein